MKKIMLIEDEKQLNIILSEILEEKGYKVDSFYSGDKVLESLFSKTYDLIILDWMLPDIEGIDLIDKIRELSKANIIMITAKSDDIDEIRAFKLDISDYIRKPFNIDIFLLRIKRLLSDTNKIYEVKNIKLNVMNGKCFVDNIEIELSPREYNLFLYLLENPNQIHSREKLLDYVWGYDFYGDIRTVDTHIKTLRKKLGKNIIKTKRSLGYLLELKYENKK